MKHWFLATTSTWFGAHIDFTRQLTRRISFVWRDPVRQMATPRNLARSGCQRRKRNSFGRKFLTRWDSQTLCCCGTNIVKKIPQYPSGNAAKVKWIFLFITDLSHNFEIEIIIHLLFTTFFSRTSSQVKCSKLNWSEHLKRTAKTT